MFPKYGFMNQQGNIYNTKLKLFFTSSVGYYSYN
jgi:hypothetical protein